MFTQWKTMEMYVWMNEWMNEMFLLSRWVDCRRLQVASPSVEMQTSSLTTRWSVSWQGTQWRPTGWRWRTRTHTVQTSSSSCPTTPPVTPAPSTAMSERVQKWWVVSLVFFSDKHSNFCNVKDWCRLDIRIPFHKLLNLNGSNNLLIVWMLISMGVFKNKIDSYLKYGSVIKCRWSQSCLLLSWEHHISPLPG